MLSANRVAPEPRRTTSSMESTGTLGANVGGDSRRMSAGGRPQRASLGGRASQLRHRRRSSLTGASASALPASGDLVIHPAFESYTLLKDSGLVPATGNLTSSPSARGLSREPQNASARRCFNSHYTRRHFLGTLLSIIERPRLRPYFVYYVQVRFFPILWLFLDFFQMTMFNNVLRIEYSLSCNAKPLSSEMADELRSVLFFWISLSAVIVGVLIVMSLWFLVGTRLPKVLVNLIGSYVNVISTFLYTFILRHLWQEAMCHVAHSGIDAKQECDTADGQLFLILAPPVTLYFLLASLVLALNSYEVDPNATHILRREHGLFDVLYILGKTVIVAVSFANSGFLRALCNLAVFSLLFTAMATLAPHHVSFINRLRTGLHLGMVLSAATGVVNEALPTCSSLPSLLYYIVLIPVVLLGAMVNVPDSIRYRVTKTLYKPFSPLVMSSIRSIMELKLTYLLVSATRLGQVAYEIEVDDPGTAEKFYLRAHMADRNHVTNLGRYAFHLVRTSGSNTKRRQRKAVQLFKRALAIDKNNAEVLALYAVYQTLIEKSDVEADQLYRQSVQVTRESSSLRRHFSSRNKVCSSSTSMA
ncbi:uncharacterized protein AMSG_11929 [Thecamonas trahens ATCC 50062]|uniref:Uncharacterized protein n=1 Tax=Thecamonas trahens ATCC 50062 TaxID=461836 RepID=A0A0L0DBW2_THETB|nr:hypothetical protein AMSG_11929 [Thecamonas trahens ATCC 50062]KNC49725.1 hypothetical protein AMSG_11929 [Thecamonas trahens ATCC 50062]|eukprot:XP_013757609.1 hypothetical protein AMSG_11929 [Thecamonas trahens ATCC 50062]